MECLKCPTILAMIVFNIVSGAVVVDNNTVNFSVNEICLYMSITQLASYSLIMCTHIHICAVMYLKGALSRIHCRYCLIISQNTAFMYIASSVISFFQIVSSRLWFGVDLYLALCYHICSSSHTMLNYNTLALKFCTCLVIMLNVLL